MCVEECPDRVVFERGRLVIEVVLSLVVHVDEFSDGQGQVLDDEARLEHGVASNQRRDAFDEGGVGLDAEAHRAFGRASIEFPCTECLVLIEERVEFVQETTLLQHAFGLGGRCCG